MQMCHFLLKMLLPDFFHLFVGFILIAGIIQVTFRILVVQQIFQPSAGRVQQCPILGHMLLLDHGDLLIQLAALFALIERALVHIIVHGLLFRRRDDGRIQAGNRRAGLKAQRTADAVPRVTVLGDSGATRHDFGVLPHQTFRVDAVLHLQQVRVAVQVVKVLQQCQIHHLHRVRVRLPLRQNGRQVHRQLLIADGGLQ